MFTKRIVAIVLPFNDNGSVVLQCIEGKLPVITVLSQTIAQKVGIQSGKTYLLGVEQKEEDQIFGFDFLFTKLKELNTGKEIANAIKELNQNKYEQIHSN